MKTHLPSLILFAAVALPLVSCGADAIEQASAESVAGESLYQLDSEWTDQSGAPHQLSDYRGKVVVTAMIFTHCSYACPRIVLDMQGIEAALPEERRDDVQFLLISMDTERDTPAVLTAFSEAKGLDPKHWTLVHGDDYAVRGIAATLGVRYKRDAKGDFAHSNFITVLDVDGCIVHQLQGLNADATPSVDAILTHLP